MLLFNNHNPIKDLKEDGLQSASLSLMQQETALTRHASYHIQKGISHLV
jgi:hypothetical protein